MGRISSQPRPERAARRSSAKLRPGPKMEEEMLFVLVLVLISISIIGFRV